MINKPLIITVKEARKLLGTNYQTAKDEEVKEMISNCESVARLIIRQYMVRKSRVVK